MGIKGIFKELGPGERVSLARLAVEKLGATGRPLRLAIDFSIWQFQAQAAHGGSNPAIRTLFYRLVRLLGLGVHAVFIVDGPHKPQMKRNKRSGRGGDAISSAMGRELIELFGFVWHQAPGEAEAEAAMMQQMGLVDAVLSEDVDTIMFGCTETMRHWSPEKSAVGPPTHVTVYRVGADETGARGNVNGIDRFGMVLIALMSGGDYQPEGLPGFGIGIACEAARAGFGRSLCEIRSEAPAAFDDWREQLTQELHENKSGFFARRHTALSVPSDFPTIETLQCYTHPVVSCKPDLARKMRKTAWGRDPDIAGLRVFAERTFDWVTYATTVKFINLLAPSLLVHRMLMTRASPDPATAMKAVDALIHKIGSSRAHSSTDGLTELRVSYVPNEIIKIHGLAVAGKGKMLPFSRDGLAINRDDAEDLGYLSDVPNSGDDESDEEVLPKQDPSQPQLVWIPESFLEFGAPHALAVSRSAPKKTAKPRKKKVAVDVGAMDKYVVTTKVTTKTRTKKVDEGEEAETVKAVSVKAKKTVRKNIGGDESDADLDEPASRKRRSRSASSESDLDIVTEETKKVIPRSRAQKTKELLAFELSDSDEPGEGGVGEVLESTKMKELEATLEEPVKKSRAKKAKGVEATIYGEVLEPVKKSRAKKVKEVDTGLEEETAEPVKKNRTKKAKEVEATVEAAIEEEAPAKKSRAKKAKEVEANDGEVSEPAKKSRAKKAKEAEASLEEAPEPVKKSKTKKVKETEAATLVEEASEPTKKSKSKVKETEATLEEISEPAKKSRAKKAKEVEATVEEVLEPIAKKDASVPKSRSSKTSELLSFLMADAEDESALPTSIPTSKITPTTPPRKRTKILTRPLKAALEDGEEVPAKRHKSSTPDDAAKGPAPAQSKTISHMAPSKNILHMAQSKTISQPAGTTPHPSAPSPARSHTLCHRISSPAGAGQSPSGIGRSAAHAIVVPDSPALFKSVRASNKSVANKYVADGGMAALRRLKSGSGFAAGAGGAGAGGGSDEHRTVTGMCGVKKRRSGGGTAVVGGHRKGQTVSGQASGLTTAMSDEKSLDSRNICHASESSKSSEGVVASTWDWRGLESPVGRLPSGRSTSGRRQSGRPQHKKGQEVIMDVDSDSDANLDADSDSDSGLLDLNTLCRGVLSERGGNTSGGSSASGGSTKKGFGVGIDGLAESSRAIGNTTTKLASKNTTSSGKYTTSLSGNTTASSSKSATSNKISLGNKAAAGPDIIAEFTFDPEFNFDSTSTSANSGTTSTRTVTHPDGVFFDHVSETQSSRGAATQKSGRGREGVAGVEVVDLTTFSD